jgi:hypothetical protein
MNSISSTPLRAKPRSGGPGRLLLSLTLLFFVSAVIPTVIAQQPPAASASTPSAADGVPSSWQQIPIPPLPR